ncbi:hypothetical protein, partial [Acinetobacter baumannii]
MASPTRARFRWKSSKLDAQERSETKNHCAVYRPWGWYDSVDMGGRFQ